jgi:Ca2+-dependent lipid-binding protein
MNLQVTVVSATFAESKVLDTYIRLVFGSQKFETDHIKKDEPTWNDSFIFRGDLKEVEVIAKAKGKLKDKTIGTAILHLNDLDFSKGDIEKQVVLSDKAGIVKLVISHVDQEISRSKSNSLLSMKLHSSKDHQKDDLRKSTNANELKLDQKVDIRKSNELKIDQKVDIRKSNELKVDSKKNSDLRKTLPVPSHISPRDKSPREEHGESKKELKNKRPINVRIIEARNLVAVDSGGTSDPYCVITSDKTEAKTKTINKNLNPDWDQSFPIMISEKLHIQLFDHNTIGKDRKIGDVTVTLTDLLEVPELGSEEVGEEIIKTYNLLNTDHGTLKVGFRSIKPEKAKKLKSMVSTLSTPGKSLVSVTSNVAGGIGSGVLAVGSGVATGVTTVGSGVVTGVTTVGSGVAHVGTTVGSGVVTGVTTVGSGVAHVGTTVGSGVITAGSSVGSGLVHVGTTVGSGVVTGVTTVGSGVVTGVTTVGSGVVTGVTTVGSGVISGVAAVGSGVTSGIGSAFAPLLIQGSKKSLASHSIMVRLINAEDLVSADVNGFSDPYCIVSSDGCEQQKTEIINKNLNPIWNQCFLVDFYEKFNIQVFDSDAIGSDESLGNVTLTLDDLFDVFEVGNKEIVKRLYLGHVKKGLINVGFTAVGAPDDFPPAVSMSVLAGRTKKLLEKEPFSLMISAMCASFFFGWLGATWTLFLVLLSFFVMWHFNYFRKNNRSRISKEKVLWRLGSRMSPELESVEWINRILKQAWVRLGPSISNLIISQVNPILDNNVPKFMQVQIDLLSFGERAPIVECFRVDTNKDNILRLDLQVKYAGDLELVVTVKKNERIQMPIQVEKILFLAPIRLEFEYMDSFPFVKNVGVSLLQTPVLDFDVKPCKTFDIMPIPGLSPWIIDLVNLVVINQMFLFPNKFLYDASTLGNPPPHIETPKTTSGVECVKEAEKQVLNSQTPLKNSAKN